MGDGRRVMTSVYLDDEDHLFIKNNKINLTKLIKDTLGVLKGMKSDEELDREEQEYLRKVAEIRLIKATRLAREEKLSVGDGVREDAWRRLVEWYTRFQRCDMSDFDNLNGLTSEGRRELVVRAGFSDPVVCLEALRKECG